MLGIGGTFRDAPFFWSQHYDVTISYAGYAAIWDSCEIRGDLNKRDACAIYRRNGKAIAIATIGRDRLSLQAEAAMETADNTALEALLRHQ